MCTLNLTTSEMWQFSVRWPIKNSFPLLCEISRAWGCNLFPTPSFICFGGNWWGSRQFRMSTRFSVIWSLFQFLVIIDYFLGKKHIESTTLCYTLAKHARFCEPGIVTFSRRHIEFLCRRSSRKQLRENWRGSCHFRMLTLFSLIWSQFQFLVTIDYFLGKKHIEPMLYASTQLEGKLLSNRYGTRTTQRIHVWWDNECWIIPYPHVVQKSIEFSGVGSLTH